MRLPVLPTQQAKFFREHLVKGCGALEMDNKRGFTAFRIALEDFIVSGKSFSHNDDPITDSWHPIGLELHQVGLGADFMTVLRATLYRAIREQHFELCANLKVIIDDIDHFDDYDPKL